MSRMLLLWIRNVVAIVFVLSATACGLLPEVKDDTAGWSAERLYQEAHEMLATGNYTRAVKLFDTLEGRFPYGRYAQQAILEGAYANYRANETAPAIAACDRFIRTYPNHPNVDYAYYLKGIVNFREDQGLFGYVVEQDLSERDPKMTKESFGAFKELVARFPESKYAADSIERMRYLTNALLHHAPQLAAVARAGIVHRLDKDTSGLLAIAKTPVAQTDLVRQLQARTVRREYLALVHGVLVRGGSIDAPVGRHPVKRTSMAVVASGRAAVTHYEVRERFAACTLLACRLETGRTHQIRVHLASLKHPLVGDAAYGRRHGVAFHRQALHAWRLGLVHPVTRKPLQWESPLPDDFAALLASLRRAQ